VDFRELQDWFEGEELALCPGCSEPAALILEPVGSLLCFHCGLIRWPGGELRVSELQRRAPAPDA
jgi:hypothetical protein